MARCKKASRPAQAKSKDGQRRGQSNNDEDERKRLLGRGRIRKKQKQRYRFFFDTDPQTYINSVTDHPTHCRAPREFTTSCRLCIKLNTPQSPRAILWWLALLLFCFGPILRVSLLFWLAVLGGAGPACCCWCTLLRPSILTLTYTCLHAL